MAIIDNNRIKHFTNIAKEHDGSLSFQIINHRDETHPEGNQRYHEKHIDQEAKDRLWKGFFTPYHCPCGDAFTYQQSLDEHEKNCTLKWIRESFLEKHS